MTWSATQPQGLEVRKTRWRAMPYLRGKVLDLGCGPEKVIDTKNVVGVDSCKDTLMFGIQMNPDVKAEVDTLGLFASGSVDAVFSSHVLEHFDYAKVPAMLKEWFRVVRTDGHLVLYLPDEAQYPKVGEPHANKDHRWNVNYEAVVEAAKLACPAWDLVHFEKCSADDEYSLFFAFKKLKWN